MPRKLCIEYPGAIYYVMNREDRQEPIFEGNLRPLSSSSGLHSRQPWVNCVWKIFSLFRLTYRFYQTSIAIVTYIAVRWQLTGNNRADRGRGSR